MLIDYASENKVTHMVLSEETIKECAWLSEKSAFEFAVKRLESQAKRHPILWSLFFKL